LDTSTGARDGFISPTDGVISVPAFAQQGAAIERGLRAGTGAGVEMRLRASFEAAPCRACASRALALRGDGLVDSMSSVAGLKKPMPRAF